MTTAQPAIAKMSLSSSSPSYVAPAMGVVVGILMVASGLYLMFGSETSTTLNVAIVIVGLTEVFVSFYTLRSSRVAWAFALSTNATACVVLLFSAPRIRDATEISLGLAILPCLIFGMILTLYALDSKKF